MLCLDERRTASVRLANRGRDFAGLKQLLEMTQIFTNDVRWVLPEQGGKELSDVISIDDEEEEEEEQEPEEEERESGA